MQLGPLAHEAFNPRWQAAVEHVTGVDRDPRVVLAVSDVEVRGRMVLHKHADHDAIEDADRGHQS